MELLVCGASFKETTEDALEFGLEDLKTNSFAVEAGFNACFSRDVKRPVDGSRKECLGFCELVELPINSNDSRVLIDELALGVPTPARTVAPADSGRLLSDFCPPMPLDDDIFTEYSNFLRQSLAQQRPNR